MNSPLVKLDIFFKSLLNCEFISAKSFIFVLAQVWTHLLIYIFWLVYNNGFRIINPAFIFVIGKECVPMANVRAKRYGPRMSLDGSVAKVGVASDPKRVGPASRNLEYG